MGSQPFNLNLTPRAFLILNTIAEMGKGMLAYHAAGSNFPGRDVLLIKVEQLANILMSRTEPDEVNAIEALLQSQMPFVLEALKAEGQLTDD